MPVFTSLPPVPGPPSPGVGVLTAVLAGGIATGTALLLIGAYTVYAVSKETNSPPLLLAGRLFERLRTSLARARERWLFGEVRRSWQQEKGALFWPLLAVLSAELLLVASLGVLVGDEHGDEHGGGWSAGFGPFAVTVVLSTCLLFNSGLALLWLAGPEPGQPGFTQRLRQVFQPGKRALAVPALRVVPLAVGPEAAPAAGRLLGPLTPQAPVRP